MSATTKPVSTMAPATLKPVEKPVVRASFTMWTGRPGMALAVEPAAAAAVLLPAPAAAPLAKRSSTAHQPPGRIHCIVEEPEELPGSFSHAILDGREGDVAAVCGAGMSLWKHTPFMRICCDGGCECWS